MEEVRYVTVELDIKYGLQWQDIVGIYLEGHVILLSIERIFDGTLFISGGVELKRDRHGRTSYTKIKCSMVPLEEADEFRDEGGENNRSLFYLIKAQKAINKLLNLYRVEFSDEYHVEKLRLDDVINYRIYFTCFDGTIKAEIVQAYPNSMMLAPSNKKISSMIKQMLQHDKQFPLWKTAIINAKNKFELEDYEEAIIQSNICLENFLYNHIFDRLESKMSKEEIESYLFEYKPPNKKKYSTTYYRELRVIFEYIYKQAPVKGESYQNLYGLFKQVKDKRNLIVHGRETENVTKQDALKSIEAMEKIIELSFDDYPMQITITPISDNIENLNLELKRMQNK